MEANLLEALEALRQLAEDASVPKKVRSQIGVTIVDLESSAGEISLKVAKALSNIEDLSENLNLESFVRMELYNIVGLLEYVKN